LKLNAGEGTYLAVLAVTSTSMSIPWVTKTIVLPLLFQSIPRAAYALMPSHNERDSVRVLWQCVATPNHVQIRPDKKIIEAIDAPRRFAIDIENR
jgi:hypothetical protein